MSDSLRGALRVVATLALLGVTAWWVDLGAVGAELKAARATPLLVALGLTIPLVVVLALRWRFTARRMNVDVSLGDAVAEYYASTFLNRVLPGGVLGDVGRAVRVGRRNPDAKGAAARSVVLERVSGQVVLWLAVVVGLVVWGAEGGRQVALTVAGVALGAALLLYLVTRIPGVRTSRFGRGWLLLVSEARQSFVDRGAWVVQLSLSLVSLVLLVSMYAACVQAIGAPMQLGHLMFIAPALLAATSLPISVGGWGIREAASAALFQMTGLDPSAGVAASAVFGAVNLVSALPGAVVLLRRRPPPSSSSEKGKRKEEDDTS